MLLVARRCQANTGVSQSGNTVVTITRGKSRSIVVLDRRVFMRLGLGEASPGKAGRRLNSVPGHYRFNHLRPPQTLFCSISKMMYTEGDNGLAAQRNRMNACFFVSGILYEALKLIRVMSDIFSDDKGFETSLRLVLRDNSPQPWKRCT
jgi:hypothetical protein